MQRRVSLVVSEQEPKRNSLCSEDGNSANDLVRLSISDSRRTSHFTINESEDNISCAKMGHNMSMQCQNPLIETCATCHAKPSFYCYLHHHKIESSGEELAHTNKKYLDDLDLSTSPNRPNLEEKGSVPMIGSLIYYRSKSNEEATSKRPVSREQYVPPPHEKIDSIENFTFDKTIQPFTVDNEDAVASDSENSISSPSSPLESPAELCKIYRHFSYPCMSTYNNTDEFGALNSRIHSRIKQNNEKLNQFLNNERKKDHFNNLHFHIPGLDPEPSPSSSPGTNTPTSVHSQSRDNSSTKLNTAPLSNPTTPVTNTGNNPNNTNSRHRRRLTCAMIFTRPKVVEI